VAVLLCCPAPAVGDDGGTLLSDKGLVLHFPFEEGAGAKAQDAGGQGINGDIVGSPEWVEGVKGKALLLDGETFIRLPDGDIFGIKDEMTLTFWARNDDQPWSHGTAVFGICDRSGDFHRFTRVRWGYNERYFHVLRMNQEGDELAGCYLRIGDSHTFHFYALVFRGDEVRVHRDGDQTDKGNVKYGLGEMDKKDTYNLVGTDWLKGRGRGFKGVLDEFRVYNRALTGEEIKKRFLSYDFTDYPNLVANSSFEKAALPDWPDRWISTGGYHFHRKDYALVLDPTVSRTGQNSLRFDIEEATGAYPPYFAEFRFSYPQLEPGDYVLSAYLKTDTPGMPFSMIMYRHNSETFALTNGWKRYWFPFRCPKRTYGRLILRPLLLNPKGKIWMDDVMVCRGDKPISYRPAIRDTYKPREGLTDVLGSGAPVARGEMKSPAAEPPEIDGHLNDECWTNALTTSPFVTLKGREPIKAGRGALCYDNRALYVGFRLDDPDSAAKPLRGYEHDSAEMWKDDVVEVFVDTDPSDEVYHHFVLGLGGAQWDAKVIFQKDTVGTAKFLKDGDVSWNGKWRAATIKTPTGWQAEIALPWNLFSRHLGDPAGLRVNLNRSTVGEKPEYTGWSITPERFHSPWRFAHLEGLKADWDRLRVWAEQARIVPLMEQGVYRLLIEGRNGSGKKRQFDVWVRTDEVDSRKAGTFDLSPGDTFSAHVDLRDLPEGQSVVCEVTPREGDVELAFHRFNLTTETALHLAAPRKVVKGQTLNTVLQCRYPAELIRDAILECRAGSDVKGSGNSVKSSAVQTGVNDLRLSTQDLPPGPAWLEAVLKVHGKTRRSGKVGFDVLPADANLVTMDPLKGMVIANEPFLPIGVCLHGKNEYHLPDLKAHGINTLFWFLRLPEQDADAKDQLGWLDQLHKHGFRVILDQSLVSRRHHSKFPESFAEEQRVNERIARMKKTVQALKDHPAIVAWHTIDEPRCHHPEMGDLKYMTMMYEAIKEIDPDRPVICNLGTTGLRTKHASVETSDVVMYDYYEFPIDSERRSFEKAQEHLRFGKQWAIETARPLYTFIGLNGGSSTSYIRMHRPVELRCRMYLDIVEGCRGLFFYSGPPCSRILWDACGEYAHQITAISPALFNPSPRLSVETDFVRLRTYVGEMDDAAIIVAVNPVHETRDVALRVTMDGTLPAKAEVLFEDRSVGLNQNQLVDAFGSYEVHVYRIAL